MDIPLHAFRNCNIDRKPIARKVAGSEHVKPFASLRIPGQGTDEVAVMSDNADFLEAIATAAMDAARMMREAYPGVVVEPDEPGISLCEHDLGEPVA